MSSDRASLSVELEVARAEIARLEALRAESDYEHNTITNLFVITRGLHETLDHDEVREVVRDVIVNFIGCEEVAFYELEAAPPDGPIGFVRTWHVGADGAPTRVAADSPLARMFQAQRHVALDPEGLEARRPEEPSAVIPLRVADKLLGAIALFSLLPQRSHFERLDEEIFSLLTSHAAKALYAAGLHRQFGRVP